VYQYTYIDTPTDGGDIKVNSGMRKEEKVFLKEDFKMIEYPKGFAKGSYSFPFQYQLPHGVPGERRQSMYYIYRCDHCQPFLQHLCVI
jgi:hypothetical protein